MATTSPVARTGDRSMITSYAAYYENLDLKQLGVDSQRVLQLFGNVNKENDELLEEIFKSRDMMPHCYVMQVQGFDSLTVLHRAMSFSAPMGGTTEPWHDKILMWKGDVVQDQLPQFYALPTKLFTQVTHVKTWTLAGARLAFQQDDSLKMLTAVPDDAAENSFDLISTRKGMYVPAELAPYFLKESPTARQAFQHVARFCQENDLEAKYSTLLDWLRVACTPEGAVKISYKNHPSSPVSGPALIESLLSVAKQDLQHWNQQEAPPPSPGVEASTLDKLVSILLEERTTRAPRAEDGGTAEATNKMPSQIWGRYQLDKLLRYCRVTNEEHLPELWHVLANSKKDQRRSDIQTLLERKAKVLQLPIPTATQDLTTMLYKLEFFASYDGELEKGLQPFVVAYLGEVSVAQQENINQIHDMLQDGKPTLSELIDLKAAGKLTIPTDALQVSMTVRAFAVVLAVVLGNTHPLYKQYKSQFVDRFDLMLPKLQNLAVQHPRELVYAQVLRWLQLRFNTYWTSVGTTLDGTIDLPNFQVLEQELGYKTWSFPGLPAAYLAPSTEKKKRKDAGRPGDVDRGSPPGNNNDTKGKYHSNDNKKADLIAFGDAIGKITPFLNKVRPVHGAPPKDSNNKELCLSWHVKGGCFSNCRRLTENDKAHSSLDTETEEKLKTYLEAGVELMANE